MSYLTNPYRYVSEPAGTIKAFKTVYAGNSRTSLGINDSGDIVSDDRDWDYWADMVSATEWGIFQRANGSPDEMSFNPNTYDSGTDQALTIKITHDSGTVTDCQYYVNAIEVTPSFSFVAHGDGTQVGFAQIDSSIATGTKMQLSLASQAWTILQGSPTVSTTSHTNDTMTRTSESGVDQICTTPLV